MQINRVWNLNTLKITQIVTNIKFSSTPVHLSRKTRKTYDTRDTMKLTGADVGPHRPGGTTAMAREVGLRDDMPQLPGVHDRLGKFHFVPEMVPEFVVPDLTNFTLKPYVSYRVDEVTQSEMTARDLFDATYGPTVQKKLSDDKLDIENVTVDELLKDP